MAWRGIGDALEIMLVFALARRQDAAGKPILNRLWFD